MLFPFLETRRFILILLLFFTTSAVLWVLFSNPLFPKVTLYSNELPYRFAVLGFIPPFWLLFFKQKKLAAIFLFFITPLLFFLNLNMLRPDLFFVWLSLITACFSNSKEQFFSGLLIILSGMYLWAGIHKVHMDFVKNTAWVFEIRLFGNSVHKYVLYALAATIPVLEIILGIFCFSKTSKFRRLLGIGLHVGILLFLVSIKWNATMIPWNVLLLLIHVLLVCGFDSREYEKSKWLKVPATMAIILPALYFVNIFPGFLSWDMYSARIQHIYMPVSDELALNPPEYVRKFVYKKDELYVISLSEWADNETGGPHIGVPVFKDRVIESCQKFLKDNPR